MPQGDRTGPAGQGPKTGREAGYCTGNDTPGYQNPPSNACPYCGKQLEDGIDICPTCNKTVKPGRGQGGIGRGMGPGRGTGPGRIGIGRGMGPGRVLNQSKLNDTEHQIVEAIGNLFKSGNEDVLGLVHRDETSHHFEKQWNTIEEMFALKVIKSPFHEELTSAFRDIHSYKYVDDSTFPIALRKRLTARGIPTEEIVNAEKHLQEICEELKKENFQEKAAGWNPNLDQIIDITKNANNRKPSQEEPFTGGGPAPDPNEIA